MYTPGISPPTSKKKHYTYILTPPTTNSHGNRHACCAPLPPATPNTLPPPLLIRTHTKQTLPFLSTARPLPQPLAFNNPTNRLPHPKPYTPIAKAACK